MCKRDRCLSHNRTWVPPDGHKRGDPYGLLAAHPVAPLVSLHHIDAVSPMFPSHTHLDSLKSLFRAYQVDPARILQQSFCYDHRRNWSISVSWGYTAQLYPWLVPAHILDTPLQTFQTWRSRSQGPFTFDTRQVTSDPCEQPVNTSSRRFGRLRRVRP